MRVHTPRFLIVLTAAAILGVACGGERAPVAFGASSTTTTAADPWTGIEPTFLAACAEPTDGSVLADATDDPAAVAAFCRCAFIETVEFYGDAEAFTAAQAGGGLDPLLDPAYQGCATLHLS